MQKVMLDTLYIVDTPEGVEIELAVAGPTPRALAWLTDFAIRGVLFVGLIYLTQSLFDNDSSRGFIAGVYSIVYFAIDWLYSTLFEALTGSTPGKRLLRLHVVQNNGTPLTASSAVIRNFLRAIDFLPFFYVTGLIAMLSNNSFSRLGDLAAGTLVVHNPKPPKPQESQHDDSRPLPAGLSVLEQQAIVRFAERSASLSAERQIELANLMEIFTGQTGQASVDTLIAWSNWIIHGQGNAETNAV